MCACCTVRQKRHPIIAAKMIYKIIQSYKSRQVASPHVLLASSIRQDKQMEDKFNIKATKGFWTPQRDKKLIELVRTYGGKLSWPQLAKAFPGVLGKYIRERYRNHLDPELKSFAWTWEQDQILKKCYIKYGNKWELISRYLPGRTANQVKNRTKRREFRELFPQPPSKKKAWNPAVYPSQRYGSNPKRPSILEEKKAIALKQEENHRRAREELKQEKQKQLIVQPPLPNDFLQKIHGPHKSNRERMSKTKKMELTSLHLHRTYQMIKSQLTKRNPSDFYLIFQTNTKREIFTKIKAIQWTITQLWPLVTNRSNSRSHAQQIAFFLYCLIKADNTLANKILHRLLKCGDEDYLIRKVQKIIEDIDQFISTELEIVRQKEMMEKNNIPTSLKAELQESQQTNDTGAKNEEGRQKQEPPREGQLDAVDKSAPQAVGNENSNKISIKMEANYSAQHNNASQKSHPDIVFPQYDLDFAMLSKVWTIGNQIINFRPVNLVKTQQKSARSPLVAKKEVEHIDTQEQAQQSSDKQAASAHVVQLSSGPNFQPSSELHQAYNEGFPQIGINDGPAQIEIEESSAVEMDGPIEINMNSSYEYQSQIDQIPMPQCVEFRRVDFVIELTEHLATQESAQWKDYGIMPFYEQQHSSQASSSFVGTQPLQEAEQKYSEMSNSSEVLMRVKYENIEDNNNQNNTQKEQSARHIPNFQQILRSKIMGRLKKDQSQQAMLN